MLPRALLESPLLVHIKVNPVAITTLVKVLKRVVALEAPAVGLSEEELSRIAQESNGDIRGALNTLQFICGDAVAGGNHPPAPTAKRTAKGSVKPPKIKKTAKLGLGSELPSSGVGRRDAAIDLFRGLGRILHAKIDTPSEEPSGDSTGTPVVTRIPERVIDDCHMSVENFGMFLHENFVGFFSDIDDIAVALSYMSTADVLMGPWVHRDVMGGYAGALLCRGTILANSHPYSPKWHPIRKPKLFAVGQEVGILCRGYGRIYIRGYETIYIRG